MSADSWRETVATTKMGVLDKHVRLKKTLSITNREHPGGEKSQDHMCFYQVALCIKHRYDHMVINM